MYGLLLGTLETLWEGTGPPPSTVLYLVCCVTSVCSVRICLRLPGSSWVKLHLWLDAPVSPQAPLDHEGLPAKFTSGPKTLLPLAALAA